MRLSSGILQEGKPIGQRQLGSRPAMRSGSNRTLRSVYYRASPHPTRGKRRSYARNCRRSPAAVRGSALELASADVAAHLAAVVRSSSGLSGPWITGSGTRALTRAKTCSSLTTISSGTKKCVLRTSRTVGIVCPARPGSIIETSSLAQNRAIRRMRDYGNRGGRAVMCSARWCGSQRHLGGKPC